MDQIKGEEVFATATDITETVQLHVLSDLQLALVGGGIGETIL